MHDRYLPKHSHFGEYSPGESIPFMAIKERLRPATFLGKSLTRCLVEYEIVAGSKYRIVICPIEDNVVYPNELGARCIHAKYDVKYWCIERNFALLENAALNNAQWSYKKTLMETYLEARNMMAEGLIQKIAKGKKLRGYERTVFRQPQLAMFDETQIVGSGQE